MDEKVIEYKIVSVWDEDLFGKIIIEYLDDGWELFGSPFFAEKQFRQAIVKFAS